MLLAIIFLSANKALAASQTTQSRTEAPSALNVGNATCPVSGEKIGTMGEAAHYEYQGKIYNLCCPMCAKDFAKDPEQYSKKAEGAAKIQTNQNQSCGCSAKQSCSG